MSKCDSLFRERIYELASLIAIKYGGKGHGNSRYTEDHILEFWKHGPPYPTLSRIRSSVKTSQIKWYIYHKMNLGSEGLWNPDFLMGLIQHGILKWNVKSYPSFSWNDNAEIKELISHCPYGGVIGKTTWVNVPALYLKFSEDSLSYMAGVMSGACLVEEDGFQYAQFNEKTSKLIEQWGIPIDKVKVTKVRKVKSYLISPIWPALFSMVMPNDAGKKWMGLKNAYGIDQYAPILWRVYVNGHYPKDGIPYLKSKRTIYYQNESEEGATKRIEKMRVEKGLTGIDKRVKEIVQLWAKKVV